MKKIMLGVALVLTAIPCFPQNIFNNNRLDFYFSNRIPSQGRAPGLVIDVTGNEPVVHFAPATGTAFPTYCGNGQLFYRTDFTAGTGLHVCVLGSWYQISGGGGGASLKLYDSGGTSQGTISDGLQCGTNLSCAFSSGRVTLAPDTTYVATKPANNAFLGKNTFQVNNTGQSAGFNLVPNTLPTVPASGDVMVDAGGSLYWNDGTANRRVPYASVTLTNNVPLFGCGNNCINVGSISGTGLTLIAQTTPTITSPVITDLSNMQHGHTSASTGGQVTPSSALAATGTPSSSTYLRGDNTWSSVSAGATIGAAVSGGTAGSILFVDSSGNLAQNNAKFFLDLTNNLMVVGSNASNSTDQLQVNGSAQAYSFKGNRMTPPTLTLAVVGTPGSSSISYRVEAVGPDGTVSGSNASGGDVNILTSPATLNGSNYIQLSWTAVTGAASYNVYRTFRNTTAPTTTGKIASVAAGTTTFNDTNIATIGSLNTYIANNSGSMQLGSSVASGNNVDVIVQQTNTFDIRAFNSSSAGIGIFFNGGLDAIDFTYNNSRPTLGIPQGGVMCFSGTVSGAFGNQVVGQTGQCLTTLSGSNNGVTYVTDGTATSIATTNMRDLAARGLTFIIANAGTTGTTANMLAKLTGAPSTAVIAATTDTSGVVGIVISGAGTSGNAVIATAGTATCTFDAGGVTAGDYVQISSTTNGNCKTGGSTFPASGQVIGRALATVASGNALVLLNLQR